MAKKQLTVQIPQLTQQECKELFEDIFFKYEDNWHGDQDAMLLDKITEEKRIPDSVKIELLLKKYRDTARDLNLYSK